MSLDLVATLDPVDRPSEDLLGDAHPPSSVERCDDRVARERNLVVVVAQRFRVLQLGVGRPRERLSACRSAAERLLGAERAPRLVRHAAEREASIPHRAAVDLERGRDRDERELERGASAHLPVRRARGDRQRRQLDRDDQVAAVEDGVEPGLVRRASGGGRRPESGGHRPARQRARRRRTRRARPPCRTGGWRCTAGSGRESRDFGGRPPARGTRNRGRACCMASSRLGSTRSACAEGGSPPVVAQLRIWPEAPESSACASAG